MKVFKDLFPEGFLFPTTIALRTMHYTQIYAHGFWFENAVILIPLLHPHWWTFSRRRNRAVQMAERYAQ